MNIQQLARIVGGIAAALLMTCGASAQTPFPSKPVTIIVGYPPGGGADISARILAQELSTIWKQPVIVESKPGAGTTLSAAYVARAQPDGYTLLMSTIALATSQTLFRKNLTYDYAKDLAPVSLVARSPFVLAVRPDSRFTSLTDLIAAMKERPGALNFGSAGPASIPHLAAAAINAQTGTQATHVPFQGMAPAVTALLGGSIDFAFVDISALPMLRGGKLKALATTGRTRIDSLPGVPTVAESLPNFDLYVWAGLEAPAGTPPRLIAQISTAVNQAVRSPAFVKKYAEMEQEAISSTPEELGALKASDIRRFEKLIEQSGVKLD
jgi:tripartite-type tricarboxylate transporter receptor subunit TctC